MTEEPLIYTSKGNVPIACLRYEHEWVDGHEVLMFHERWFLGDELVKNNMHGYVKKGVSMGGEQAKM